MVIYTRLSAEHHSVTPGSGAGGPVDLVQDFSYRQHSKTWHEALFYLYSQIIPLSYRIAKSDEAIATTGHLGHGRWFASLHNTRTVPNSKIDSQEYLYATSGRIRSLESFISSSSSALHSLACDVIRAAYRKSSRDKLNFYLKSPLYRFLERQNSNLVRGYLTNPQVNSDYAALEAAFIKHASLVASIVFEAEKHLNPKDMKNMSQSPFTMPCTVTGIQGIPLYQKSRTNSDDFASVIHAAKSHVFNVTEPPSRPYPSAEALFLSQCATVRS